MDLENGELYIHDINDIDEDKYNELLKDNKFNAMKFDYRASGIFPYKMPKYLDYIMVENNIVFLDANNFKCRKYIFDISYNPYDFDIELLKMINMEILDIRETQMKDCDITEVKCETLKMDIYSYTSSRWISSTIKKIYISIGFYDSLVDISKTLGNLIFQHMEVNLQFYIEKNDKNLTPDYINNIVEKYNINSVKYILPRVYPDYINPKIKKVSFFIQTAKSSDLITFLEKINKIENYKKIKLTFNNIVDNNHQEVIINLLSEIAIKTPIFGVSIPYNIFDYGVPLKRVFYDKIRYSAPGAQYFGCDTLMDFDDRDYSMLKSFPLGVEKIKISYQNDTREDKPNSENTIREYGKTIWKKSIKTKGLRYFAKNLKPGGIFSDIDLLFY